MHCPECGTKASPEAEHCAACGNVLPTLAATKNAPSAVARTMLGVAAASLPQRRSLEVDQDAATLVKPGSKERVSAENRTIVGMPAEVVANAARPKPPENQRTLLGMPAGAIAAAQAQKNAPAEAPSSGDGTLLGVARPGIAPIRDANSRAENPAKPANGKRQMPHELGATFYEEEAARPSQKHPDKPQSERARAAEKLARRRLVLPPVRDRADERDRERERDKARAKENKRRAMPIIITAAALIVFAVLFAIFWRSPPPLQARVRATQDGRDALEITCPNCPDGTRATIGAASATLQKNTALIPLTAPLMLGENRLKVALDRPGGGRDESVGVSVQVGYRLRPDLGGLSADKPSVSVVVEALSGTSVELDGKPVSLKDGPTAVVLDVTSECSGSSDETTMLKRKMPYLVKTADGVREEGAVDIAVGIVPLRIDAPGPRVVVDSETFVLAGQTMKGAEVFAAGRPIQVGADGSFAQRMSVSSVGSTSIDVRAKFAGMAPRIVPIAVRRVERLEMAAREMMANRPLNYAGVLSAGQNAIGKDVAITGEIADVRTQNHQSIFLLDVSSKDGCPNANEPCHVRLIHGFPNPAKAGDKITAYGQLGRLAVSGNETMPEVIVAFTVMGNR